MAVVVHPGCVRRRRTAMGSSRGSDGPVLKPWAQETGAHRWYPGLVDPIQAAATGSARLAFENGTRRLAPVDRRSPRPDEAELTHRTVYAATRAVSSVGQSASLTPRKSLVRVQYRPPPRLRSMCSAGLRRSRLNAAVRRAIRDGGRRLGRVRFRRPLLSSGRARVGPPVHPRGYGLVACGRT